MDTEFEDLVADSLQQKAASVRIPASLTGMAKRARRRHRQRQFALRGGLTAGTAVGAAAAVVVAFGASAPQAAGPKLRAQTAAYIVSRAERSLARDTAQVIEYVRMTGSPDIEGTNSSGSAVWSYGSRSLTVNYAADGNPVLANQLRNVKILNTQGELANTLVNFTQVSYPSRTWWRVITDVPIDNITPPKRCQANLPTYVQPPPNGTQTTQWIRYYLECGLFVVAGRQHVDGIDAIKIVQAKRSIGLRRVFWINPATYQPVRTWVEVVGDTWWQMDFQWLAPTPANLARLTVPIPVGFRRVTAPFPPD